MATIPVKNLGNITDLSIVVPSGSKTYDPPLLGTGASTTTTVSVVAALMGDLAFATFSQDLQTLSLDAWVSSPGVVTVEFENTSGGPGIDLASGTLTALVFKVNNV